MDKRRSSTFVAHIKAGRSITDKKKGISEEAVAEREEDDRSRRWVKRRVQYREERERYMRKG